MYNLTLPPPPPIYQKSNNKNRRSWWCFFWISFRTSLLIPHLITKCRGFRTLGCSHSNQHCLSSEPHTLLLSSPEPLQGTFTTPVFPLAGPLLPFHPHISTHTLTHSQSSLVLPSAYLFWILAPIPLWGVLEGLWIIAFSPSFEFSSYCLWHHVPQLCFGLVLFYLSCLCSKARRWQGREPYCADIYSSYRAWQSADIIQVLPQIIIKWIN